MEPLPNFDIPVIAMIPPAYIADAAQRLYYYQRLMTARDDGALGTWRGGQTYWSASRPEKYQKIKSFL